MIYLKARSPFAVGEERARTWAAFHGPQMGATAKVWGERARDYWDLQELVYGVRMADRRLFINESEGVVRTFATVAEVLPGERTDDKVKVTAYQ